MGDERQNTRAGRDRLLTMAEVQHLEVLLDQPTSFWGQPLVQALGHGFQITPRGVFEMTNQAAALDTAATLSQILGQTEGSKMTVVDAFAGTGQVSWAFAGRGFRVEAYERDHFTYATLSNNLRLAGMEDRIRLHYQSYANQADQTANAIYLDPPWNGNYKYSLGMKFDFDDTEPRADKLITEGLLSSPIVIFKAPQNIDIAAVLSLANTIKVSVDIVKQNTHPKNRAFGQTTVYFRRDLTGIARFEERELFEGRAINRNET